VISLTFRPLYLLEKILRPPLQRIWFGHRVTNKTVPVAAADLILVIQPVANQFTEK
jgi:hypothetical protein